MLLWLVNVRKSGAYDLTWDVQGSSRTRAQLQSLLSAVQSSLAELKNEVASARKLTHDTAGEVAPFPVRYAALPVMLASRVRSGLCVLIC